MPFYMHMLFLSDCFSSITKRPTGTCIYTSLCRYLRVLPVHVLHRADVLGIFICVGVNTTMCQRDYRLQTFLSIQYVRVDLFKHLGKDSSTDRIPIIRIGTRIYF